MSCFAEYDSYNKIMICTERFVLRAFAFPTWRYISLLFAVIANVSHARQFFLRAAQGSDLPL